MSVEERFLEQTQPAGIEQEKFVIDTAAKADWAIGLIRKQRKEIAAVKDYVEAKKAALDEFAAKEIAPMEGTILKMTELLRPYAEAKLEGKKTRTVKTAEGSLSFRKGTTEYIKDDAKLLDFVGHSAPEYLTQVPKLRWADFKATLIKAENGVLVTQDGEKVEGVTYVEKDEVFTVKTEV